MSEVTNHVADEQWETTTPGICWVNVTTKGGDIRQVKVGGRKGMKFRISAADRVGLNQDQVMEPQHDPFTNGLLNRLVGTTPVYPPQQSAYGIEDLEKEPEPADQMISFAELRKLLGKHGNSFRSAVNKLNEVNLRRLAEIGQELPEDEQISVAQQSAIDDRLATFRPGGTQPSYAEFMGGPAEGGVSAAGTTMR